MCYVLCAISYVLCAMRYVLCSMFYVLCAMWYVLEDNLAPKVGELLSILHNTAKLLYVRSCVIFCQYDILEVKICRLDFSYLFK